MRTFDAAWDDLVERPTPEAVAAAEDVLRRMDPADDHAGALAAALAKHRSEAALAALERRFALGGDGAADYSWCSVAETLARVPTFRPRVVESLRALAFRTEGLSFESRCEIGALVHQLVDDREARRAALAALPEDEIARAEWATTAATTRRGLLISLEPEAAVNQALASVMKASSDDPLGWRKALVPLAAHPDTRPSIKVGLEAIIAKNRFGFPQDDVVGAAVVLSGADCSALHRGDPFRGRRRAWKRTTELVEELIAEGVVADPDAFRASVQPGTPNLTLLELAGLGLQFDAEAGTVPVPYDQLLNELQPLAPFDWSVSHETLEDERVRYTIEVWKGDARAHTELVDNSDYFDHLALVRLLNELQHRNGDTRRYASLETRDQTAFVILEDPKKLEQRLRRFRLRREDAADPAP